MTEFQISKEDKEFIDGIEKIVTEMPEEQFVEEGYHFTFQGVKLLMGRIRQLEAEIELQQIIAEENSK